MLAWALCASSLAAAALPDPSPFEVPASLKPAVGFWVRVYAEWNGSQSVLHDVSDVDVVYRVMDLSALQPQPADSAAVRQQKKAARMDAVRQSVDELEAALEALDALRPTRAAGLKGAQLDAFNAWQHLKDDPERFGRASGRVRAQRGARNRYATGIRESGRFAGAVQQALMDAGLPAGLLALAFTESLMNLQARSVSGAVGPWQFLKGTGREYLSINTLVDERKDPVLSTLAAGRYLTQSVRRLGSWGSAITGYNYGMNGMARAQAKLGTQDIDVIIASHRSRSFGFAARNYYAEFLASLHVLTHASHYFPEVRPLPPWRFDVVVVPAPITVAQLAAAHVSAGDLSELNPALTPAALAGRVQLPTGMTLRVPQGRGSSVRALLTKLPSAPKAASRSHTLRRGETLLGVARRYGLSLGELCSANSLNPNQPVPAGIHLAIPSPAARFSRLPEADDLAPADVRIGVALATLRPMGRFVPALASRPGVGVPEIAVAALSPGQTRPAPVVLARTLPPPLPTRYGTDLEAAAWTSLSPRVMHSANGGRVAAGPLAGRDLDPVLTDVDLVVGQPLLPEVDLTVGAGWTDGTPHRTPAVPRVAPAAPGA